MIQKVFARNQGLDPPNFRKVFRIVWIFDPVTLKKNFSFPFPIFFYNNRRIFLLQNFSKKFNWVSWMKFLQFKDDLFKELNIQRPFWLKIWQKFFYEYLLWRLENAKIMKNMSEIAKTKRSLIFLGNFYSRLRIFKIPNSEPCQEFTSKCKKRKISFLFSLLSIVECELAGNKRQRCWEKLYMRTFLKRFQRFKC